MGKEKKAAIKRAEKLLKKLRKASAELEEAIEEFAENIGPMPGIRDSANDWIHSNYQCIMDIDYIVETSIGYEK